jgi:DNA-binding NtrC family response regulator
MALLSPADRQFARQLAGITYGNPFLPERQAQERAAVGDGWLDIEPHWSEDPDLVGDDPNIQVLVRQATALMDALQPRLAAGEPATEDELALYESLVLFSEYHRVRDDLGRLMTEGGTSVRGYDLFEARMAPRLAPGGRALPGGLSPPHAFAFFFQIRRAFQHVYGHIVGTSAPAARLKAQVWQSVFTHDMRRYCRSLYRRMGDVSTLVTGPSGTGKELVARAVGLSGYIPFDRQQRRFTHGFEDLFVDLNLSALSPTLIESELFGHRRGAFTGAVKDHAGWFETTDALGTVFLDEIGEVDPAIQVKLLRVLQTRTFQRLGDTVTRRFQGKILCATNRDMEREMAEGRFREDLYYRICSDRIVTPGLAEQLEASADAAAELRRLVLFIARRMAGDEAESLTDEVVTFIDQGLGASYRWPGNFRELEQCVRGVLVRGRYQPSSTRRDASPTDAVLGEVRAGELTADQVLSRYVTLVYARIGSYEGAARSLGLDRRTVKARLDEPLLAALRGERA